VVTQDVLPFSTTVSSREVKTFGANATGLERRGFATGNIETLHKAFRLLTSGKLNTTQALARIREEVASTPELEEMLEFIRTSERGFIK
jgi:UDP-N-acetylglucosamine acyltransferase